MWQKTGWKTFAATFLTIKYEAPLNEKDAESGEGVKLHQFDKVQFAGVLKESGDRMDLTALVTVFDSDGNQLPPKEGIPDTANGVRIPPEVLPNIAYSLPTPGPTAPK